MDVRTRLARWASMTPRVLLVDAPDANTMRWQVERSVRTRGWGQAFSPSNADLLVVAGTPGPDLDAAISVLWSQMASPRQQMKISLASDVDRLLDEARLGLSRANSGNGRHGDDFVAKLGTARTGHDRDGLELDALRVSIGPVLRGWPTGLLLTCSLHGDVLEEVNLSWVDQRPPEKLEVRVGLRALDLLARFLLVAGTQAMVMQAYAARDRWHSADAGLADEGRQAAQRLARHVRRSWALAWSVSGLGLIDAGPSDLTPHSGAWDRLVRWCRIVESGGESGGGDTDAHVDLAALGRALNGLDVASARLVVASLDLRLGGRPPSGDGHHG